MNWVDAVWPTRFGGIFMAESQNIEWKESWRDEYLKWICGFANAQGGKIYIGTNDGGTVIGVQNSRKLMEDIPNKIRDILGIIVDVTLLTEDGKDYIEICVNPNTYPVNYRGEYHYRSGSTKQLLKGQALNQFLLKKTGITWDSVSIQGAEKKDLRNDSFDIFREQAVKSKRMDEPDIQVSNEQLLEFKSLYNKNTQDNTQDSTQDESLTNKERQILSICEEEKSKQEIANLMGYRTIKSIKPEVESLLKQGKLKMSIPDKPKSRNQKYIVAKDKNTD